MSHTGLHVNGAPPLVLSVDDHPEVMPTMRRLMMRKFEVTAVLGGVKGLQFG